MVHWKAHGQRVVAEKASWSVDGRLADRLIDDEGEEFFGCLHRGRGSAYRIEGGPGGAALEGFLWEDSRCLQVREADLVDLGGCVIAYPDTLAFTIHIQAFTIVDERHRVAFQNLALQVAEVDGLGLAVGNPERVPHRIVAQVGDVRDARRDFRATQDGTVGRGNTEEQAGIGLVADHQRAVAHPGDGLQPAVEGSFVNGR